MIFELTDEDRAALEEIRKRDGWRSHAETLRALIRASQNTPRHDNPPLGSSQAIRVGPVVSRGPVVDHGNGVATQEVRFGPVESAAGSRLKPGKGSK